MEKQLFFDIEEMPSFDVEDFIVSLSNQSAYDYIQKWPDWSGNLVFLVGESGVGKTHLANIWLEKVNGIKLLQENIDINYIGMNQNILIEDVDLINYDLTGLFHLINAIKEKNHLCRDYEIISDDSDKIIETINDKSLNQKIDVIITTGGTGLTGRDNTVHSIKSIAEIEIPGFVELFRQLSY